jgi:hypothetical protein
VRSMLLVGGTLGLALAIPAPVWADELAGPTLANGDTIPVAHHWRGYGFYPGGYGYSRGYSPGFYRGYYPYGGSYSRYYGGGFYPYGGGSYSRYYGGGYYPYGGGFSPYRSYGVWPYSGYFW